MATFRFELSGRPTKNKTFVVYLRATIGGKRKLLKTAVEVNRPADFNAKCKGENWIRANVPDAKKSNAYLAEVLSKAKNTYKELDKEGEVSTTLLAKEMKTEKVSPSFIAFAKERTQMSYDAGGFRNWKKYNGFLNKLETFRKKRRMHDITIDDLTVDFLTKFDNFLRKCENEREPGKLLHPNTIEVIFNVMRAIVNKAIESGILEASKNPFLIFRYKGVKTMKEKLSDADIDKIKALELEENSLLWHCKNYFLFSFYCAGIRAADLIQLRWNNITADGRLRYQMGKNHKVRDLVLVKQAKTILAFYHNPSSAPTDYIFPLLSNEAPYAKFVSWSDIDRMKPEMRQKLYEDVSAKNALINKYLKKIAEKSELGINLTMHMSRHAFAHIALEKGVESAAIKDILGHSNLATTERYMGSFDTTRTDNTIKTLFNRDESPRKKESLEQSLTKEEQAIELLKGMTPEQIMSIIATINK